MRFCVQFFGPSAPREQIWLLCFSAPACRSPLPMPAAAATVQRGRAVGGSVDNLRRFC